MRTLRPIYMEGFDYAKAGLTLGDLVQESGIQEDLFSVTYKGVPDAARSERLMAVMDAINWKTRAMVSNNVGANTLQLVGAVVTFILPLNKLRL